MAHRFKWHKIMLTDKNIISTPCTFDNENQQDIKLF